MADPIITGREELGFSKVFATLESKNTSSGLFGKKKEEFEVSAGWEGMKFCHLKIEDLVEETSNTEIEENPIYHWKVSPSAVKKGDVDAEYVCVSRLKLDVGGKKERKWEGGKAEIKQCEFEGAELERALPALRNIVRGSRGIEVKEVVGCGARCFLRLQVLYWNGLSV